MEESILEFGIKRENEERRDGGCAVVFDPKSQRYAVGLHEYHGAYWLFSGGLEEGEEAESGILREVTEESGLCDFGHVEKIDEALAHYHNRLKNVNRVAHATCFLVILKSTKRVPVHLEAHETFTLAWKSIEEVLQSWTENNQGHSVDHWIYFFKKAIARVKELGYDTTSLT